MARSDQREIRSRLIVLLTHLLKCSARPERRSSSWLGTIDEQRDGIAQLIKDSPSLRNYPARILDDCYPAARRNAANQMRLSLHAFPEHSPFGVEEVLDAHWLPGRTKSPHRPAG